MSFRRAIYAAQVDRMDQNIGRIIDYLKANDQYDNTLIIFLSDNGCSAETGMFGFNFDKYKISNYNEWKKNQRMVCQPGSGLGKCQQHTFPQL